MSQVTLGGNPVFTNGELPAVGTTLSNYQLINADLQSVSLENFKGKKVVYNIFPSIDTGTCAASVRTFNQRVAALENTVVLCVSRDLPFAQKRFCGAEGIENVQTLSDFKEGAFGNALGLILQDGPLSGLHARAVVVTNEEGVVLHTELVSEIANEPNYDAALAVL